MAQITVSGLGDEILERLKARATAHGRSLAQKVAQYCTRLSLLR
ncbi:MAG: FitA-like ribbon-helix-helix domain-containing protein [Pseudomonadota bacterium]